MDTTVINETATCSLDSMLLIGAVLVPIICAAGVAALGCKFNRVSKAIAVLGFLFPLVAAGMLWKTFMQVSPGADYMFLTDIDMGLSIVGISLKMGLNGISMALYLLASVVGLAAGLYAIFSKVENKHWYVSLLLVMQAGLMGVFSSVDIFFFYFFHEFALIPTFIMIGIWGGRERRYAAMEMTIYLTAGAMISLLGIIALYAQSGLNSFDMITLKMYLTAHPLGEIVQNNIFALLLIGFGILVSLFPFHSWAPRGYAAAPASAAMLHAGVLKKFGLYGLVQIAAPLLPLGVAHYGSTILWLALGNVILIGLITMTQTDLKRMLGYSSVMHMGYAFMGVATFSAVGIGGAVMLMFAHGLSVALLFLLADCIGRRTETDEMPSMGGLFGKTPILCGFFVAATMASVGLPGFANFWGEFSLFVSIWHAHPGFAVGAVLGIIISAIYGLRAVARIFYGDQGETVSDKEISDLSLAERLPAIVLFIALIAVGIFPRLISDDVNKAVSATYPQAQVVEIAPASVVNPTHTADHES